MIFSDYLDETIIQLDQFLKQVEIVKNWRPFKGREYDAIKELHQELTALQTELLVELANSKKPLLQDPLSIPAVEVKNSSQEGETKEVIPDKGKEEADDLDLTDPGLPDKAEAKKVPSKKSQLRQIHSEIELEYIKVFLKKVRVFSEKHKEYPNILNLAPSTRGLEEYIIEKIGGKGKNVWVYDEKLSSATLKVMENEIEKTLETYKDKLGGEIRNYGQKTFVENRNFSYIWNLSQALEAGGTVQIVTSFLDFPEYLEDLISNIKKKAWYAKPPKPRSDKLPTDTTPKVALKLMKSVLLNRVVELDKEAEELGVASAQTILLQVVTRELEFEKIRLKFLEGKHLKVMYQEDGGSKTKLEQLREDTLNLINTHFGKMASSALGCYQTCFIKEKIIFFHKDPIAEKIKKAISLAEIREHFSHLYQATLPKIRADIENKNVAQWKNLVKLQEVNEPSNYSAGAKKGLHEVPKTNGPNVEVKPVDIFAEACEIWAPEAKKRELKRKALEKIKLEKLQREAEEKIKLEQLQREAITDLNALEEASDSDYSEMTDPFLSHGNPDSSDSTTTVENDTGLMQSIVTPEPLETAPVNTNRALDNTLLIDENKPKPAQENVKEITIIDLLEKSEKSFEDYLIMLSRELALEKMRAAVLEMKYIGENPRQKEARIWAETLPRLRSEIVGVLNARTKVEIAEHLYAFVYPPSHTDTLRNDIKRHSAEWTKRGGKTHKLLEKFEKDLKTQAQKDPELAECFYKATFQNIKSGIEKSVKEAREGLKILRANDFSKYGEISINDTEKPLLETIEKLEKDSKIPFQEKIAQCYRAAVNIREAIIAKHTNDHKTKLDAHTSQDLDTSKRDYGDFDLVVVSELKLGKNELYNRLKEFSRVHGDCPVLTQENGKVVLYRRKPSDISILEKIELDDETFKRLKFQFRIEATLQNTKALNVELKKEIINKITETEPKWRLVSNNSKTNAIGNFEEFTFVIVPQLTNVANEKELIERLRALSDDNKKIPVLTQEGNKIFLYKFSESSLPLEKIELNKEIFNDSKFSFPDRAIFLKINELGEYVEIKNELIKKIRDSEFHESFNEEKIKLQKAFAFKNIPTANFLTNMELARRISQSIKQGAEETPPDAIRERTLPGYLALEKTQVLYAIYSNELPRKKSDWSETIFSAWIKSRQGGQKDPLDLHLLKVYLAALQAKLDMLSKTASQKEGRSKLFKSRSLALIDEVITLTKAEINKDNRLSKMIDIDVAGAQNPVLKNDRDVSAYVGTNEYNRDRLAIRAREISVLIKDRKEVVNDKYFAFFGIPKPKCFRKREPQISEENIVSNSV